jgi:hypothetical protein
VIVSGILPRAKDSTEVRTELLERLTGFVRDMIPLIQKPQVKAG